MLEFNQSHKSADLSSIKAKLDKANKAGKVIISGILISSMLFFSGCSPTMYCDKEEKHFHVYTKDGIVRIIDNEKEKVDGFRWTEGTIDYSLELENELKLLDKYDLVKISDNNNYLKTFMNNYSQYTEYEYDLYENEYVLGTVFGDPALGIVLKDTPIAKQWSTNKNVSNATGNVRDVYTKYVGYRFIYEADGTVKLDKSPEVDNIFEISSEYPYFKLNDFAVKRCITYQNEKGRSR